jgi:hypothetical protein
VKREEKNQRQGGVAVAVVAVVVLFVHCARKSFQIFKKVRMARTKCICKKHEEPMSKRIFGTLGNLICPLDMSVSCQSWEILILLLCFVLNNGFQPLVINLAPPPYSLRERLSRPNPLVLA